jgi:hypothetical protein
MRSLAGTLMVAASEGAFVICRALPEFLWVEVFAGQ